jgi:hypothetical protein
VNAAKQSQERGIKPAGHSGVAEACKKNILQRSDFFLSNEASQIKIQARLQFLNYGLK